VLWEGGCKSPVDHIMQRMNESRVYEPTGQLDSDLVLGYQGGGRKQTGTHKVWTTRAKVRFKKRARGISFVIGKRGI